MFDDLVPEEFGFVGKGLGFLGLADDQRSLVCLKLLRGHGVDLLDEKISDEMVNIGLKLVG